MPSFARSLPAKRLTVAKNNFAVTTILFFPCWNTHTGWTNYKQTLWFSVNLQYNIWVKEPQLCLYRRIFFSVYIARCFTVNCNHWYKSSNFFQNLFYKKVNRRALITKNSRRLYLSKRFCISTLISYHIFCLKNGIFEFQSYFFKVKQKIYILSELC